MKPPPEKIAINHDDYDARFIGKTSDGRQFFATNPFVPAIGKDAGREFDALYLFDGEGNLLEAQILDVGTRAESKQNGGPKVAELVKSLGEVSFERIEIRPFQIERFGVTFGLIPDNNKEDLEDDDDEDFAWWVTLEPGNAMAFYEPFDSGDYDT